jgi:hypothetical protein
VELRRTQYENALHALDLSIIQAYHQQASKELKADDLMWVSGNITASTVSDKLYNVLMFFVINKVIYLKEHLVACIRNGVKHKIISAEQVVAIIINVPSLLKTKLVSFCFMHIDQFTLEFLQSSLGAKNIEYTNKNIATWLCHMVDRRSSYEGKMSILLDEIFAKHQKIFQDTHGEKKIIYFLLQYFSSTESWENWHAILSRYLELDYCDKEVEWNDLMYQAIAADDVRFVDLLCIHYFTYEFDFGLADSNTRAILDMIGCAIGSIERFIHAHKMFDDAIELYDSAELKKALLFFPIYYRFVTEFGLAINKRIVETLRDFSEYIAKNEILCVDEDDLSNGINGMLLKMQQVQELCLLRQVDSSTRCVISVRQYMPLIEQKIKNLMGNMYECFKSLAEHFIAYGGDVNNPCILTEDDQIIKDIRAAAMQTADNFSAIINTYISAPFLAHDDCKYYQIISSFDSSVDSGIVHRRYSGPSKEQWGKSDNRQKYVAVIAVNGRNVLIALPLLDATDIGADYMLDIPKFKKLFVLKLLSSLDYHVKRHSAVADSQALTLDIQAEIIALVAKVTNTTDKKIIKNCQKLLVDLQSELGYGSELLSDDSDDEECSVFASQPLRSRNALLVSARKMQEYGQVAEIFTGSGDNRKLKKVNDAAKKEVSYYKLRERAQIHHEESFSFQVQSDLQLLNERVIKVGLQNVDLGEITTKFYLMQFRGIHYDSSWSRSKRQKHRNESHKGFDIYAEAVYAKAGTNISADQSTIDETELGKKAELLQHQMQSLSFTGDLLHYDRKCFSNAAFALQDSYTKSYDAHRKYLGLINTRKQRNEVLTEAIDVAALYAIGSFSHLLSTGDTPCHALRYAYYKSYTKGRNQLMLPSIRKDGRAERPYTGMVFSFLFDLDLYIAQDPAHLVSLDHTKELSIDSLTLSERETSYKARIPKGNVLEITKAKYPSFHREYNDYFLHRYGIDEELFAHFKQALVGKDPHCAEYKSAIVQLTEHLVAYQEAGLIEDARLAARQHGGYLIYRDRTGGFSFIPPEIKPVTRGVAAAAGSALRQRQQEVKSDREQRQPTGWLHSLLQTNNILPGSSLLAVLVKMLDVKKEELENDLKLVGGMDISAEKDFVKALTLPVIVHKFLCRAIAKLKNLAIKHEIKFSLESFLFESPLTIYVSTSTKEIRLLYLGGDGIHGIVAKDATLFGSSPSSDGGGGSKAAPGVARLIDDGDGEPAYKKR